MGQGFRKFQNRVRLGALVKALLAALAVGLPVFSVLFVLIKRELITMRVLVAVLIAVGAALVSFALILIVQLPGKKRLAKRLDQELSLNEKVQTMLAFEKESGEMVELQRQDTDQRLLAIPVTSVKFRRLWIYAVALVLATAMLISAVLVPAKEPPLPPPDPDYEMDNWQQVALENLIAYVQASGMETVAKEYTVAQLQELLTALLDASKESQMKSLVLSAIVNIDAKVDGVNSYPAIKNALNATEDESLSLLCEALKALEKDASVNAFAKIKARLTADAFAGAAEALTVAMTAALKTTDYYGTSDALQTALTELSSALSALAKDATSFTPDALTEKRDAILSDASAEIHDALYQQSVNRKISNATIVELMDIFGISAEELPELDNEEKLPVGGNDHMDYDDDDYNITDGGLGSGEVLLGSEDMIYDPDQMTHVKYKDVINDYDAKVAGKIQDGTLPPEIVEYINDYFATLYGSNGT